MRHWLLALALISSGCSGSTPDADGKDDTLVNDTEVVFDDTDRVNSDSYTEVTRLEGYAFLGRTGDDSVSYGGQVFRQVLIDDMSRHLGRLTARLKGTDGAAFFPVAGEVSRELTFYLDFDSSTSGGVPHGRSADVAVLQVSYDDISAGKDLTAKIAGNDPVGQHQDWSTDLIGWDASGITTPESLVRAWFAEIDAASVAWNGGAGAALGPSGDRVPAVYITPEGRDLQQLVEKLLRGAVAYSQAADDYLDDDLEGKGLLASHAEVEEGKPYTALEHAWDEGFGYFGAARTYGDWTDHQIANVRARDVDGDGVIDLQAEWCFGHSTNAAERDLASASAELTDYSRQAWDGFVEGRRLLAESRGELDASQLDALRAHRDKALGAWELALASTVVHYLNSTIADTLALDSPSYSFAEHAKHWSELKGFALSLQFNPRSALSDAQLVDLHALIDLQPVLATATAEERSDYVDDLLAARALVGTAFGFGPNNLGDDDGLNGW